MSKSAIFIEICNLNCQIYALKTFLLHSDVNNIDIIVRFACFLLSSLLTGVGYILGHEPVSRTHWPTPNDINLDQVNMLEITCGSFFFADLGEM